jgi:pyruvate/2-oxoacid:ferredoxin oxidoreductase alpha subunit
MRHLLKGNEAVVWGAIAAGCKAYFGYPITPASEIAEQASVLLPESGGIFIPAESEIAAIQMLYGAASAGVRAMTASSGPGISLMQEGISYMAGASLPGVIVDIMRAGPGLGNLGVEQGDYFIAVKGAHGSYHTPVFAPNSVQEMCDLTVHAFEVADRYRTPTMVLADGALGQMMEPIVIPETAQNEPDKPWAVTGSAASRGNLITSIYLEHDKQERLIISKLEERYEEMEKKEVLWQEIQTEDAELLVIAYGISSRIARAAVEIARADGIRVGLLRPISLFPFPSARLRQLASKAYSIMVLELSSGQLVEDVRLYVGGITPVQLLRRTGGMMPTAEDVVQAIKTMEKDCVGNRA